MAELGVPSFDAQAHAFRVARDVLGARLRDEAPDEAATDLLAREVLPAVDRIDRGMGLTERADRMDRVTMRSLLDRAGLLAAPRTAAEHVAAEHERAELAHRGGDAIDLSAGVVLSAANHARVIFATIPRLPRDLVTWPQPRLASGYADIAAPSGIGSLFARVDELASVLWRVAAGQRVELDEHLRRTYAFCDTSRWLELSLLRD